MFKRFLIFMFLCSCNVPGNNISEITVTESDKFIETFQNDSVNSYFEFKNIDDSSFILANNSQAYYQFTDIKREHIYISRKNQFKLNKKRELVLAANENLLLYPELRVPFEYNITGVSKEGSLRFEDTNDSKLRIYNILNFELIYIENPDELKEFSDGIYEYNEKISDKFFTNTLYNCCAEQWESNKADLRF